MQGEVIFSIPISGSKTENRVIVRRLDGGGWMVGRVKRSDETTFTADFAIGKDDLLQSAAWALEGNVQIRDAYCQEAGKALAAGVIVLALEAGIISRDTE